jgi:hypothetical protein
MNKHAGGNNRQYTDNVKTRNCVWNTRSTSAFEGTYVNALQLQDLVRYKIDKSETSQIINHAVLKDLNPKQLIT